MQKLREGLLMLLALAVGLRIAAGLVGPAVGLIVVLWVLMVIYTVLFRGRR
jgi:hypothetical protein